MEESYDPSKYSDEDLKDVFWTVDRDKHPQNYEKICNEMNIRNIPYEDIPQWERKQKNLDDEIEATAFVLDKARDSMRIANAMSSLRGLFSETIGLVIRRLVKFVFK